MLLWFKSCVVVVTALSVAVFFFADPAVAVVAAAVVVIAVAAMVGFFVAATVAVVAIAVAIRVIAVIASSEVALLSCFKLWHDTSGKIPS